MAQSGEFLILDFGSGSDPRVMGSSPMSGSKRGTCLRFSLSLSLFLSLSPPFLLSLVRALSLANK